MPKTISDIDVRYKNRLMASVFQNINSALPHIERYYDDWNWSNESVSSPAELLSESWEDIFAFFSGEVPEKFSDEHYEKLAEKGNLLERAVKDLNKKREIHQDQSLRLIDYESQLP